MSGPHLHVLLAEEAHHHETEHRHRVAGERKEVAHAEAAHESTHEHEEDGARSQDGPYHEHALVGHVKRRDAAVVLYGLSRVQQQVYDVRHGRRCPTPSLRKELFKGLWTAGVGIRRRTVFHLVALLEQ